MSMKITGRTQFLFFCIGFCLGVLFVNIGKGIWTESTGFFSEDTLYRMKYMTVSGDALFSYVLGKRLFIVLVLIIACTTYLGIIACRGIVLWYGMSFGILICTVTMRYGMKGMLLAIVSIFPHYILYVPAMLLLLGWCEELYRSIYRRQGDFDIHNKRDMLRKATRLLGILVLIVSGCAAEGYVNSALLIKFLQVF